MRHHEKFLAKLPLALQERILQAIADASVGNVAHLDRKKLKGEKGAWRIRIGSVRIEYHFNDTKFILDDITYRKDAYK